MVREVFQLPLAVVKAALLQVVVRTGSRVWLAAAGQKIPVGDHTEGRGEPGFGAEGPAISSWIFILMLTFVSGNQANCSRSLLFSCAPTLCRNVKDVKEGKMWENCLGKITLLYYTENWVLFCWNRLSLEGRTLRNTSGKSLIWLQHPRETV